MSERDDNEKAEIHELMDMPEWKARKIVQENFDKADAEFRKSQMVGLAGRQTLGKAVANDGQVDSQRGNLG